MKTRISGIITSIFAEKEQTSSWLAKIFLALPVTVTASAIVGKITDPRKFYYEYEEQKYYYEIGEKQAFGKRRGWFPDWFEMGNGQEN